jgi:hypothetical protein
MGRPSACLSRRSRQRTASRYTSLGRSSSQAVELMKMNKEHIDFFRDIEKKLEDREAFCVSVQKKQTENSIEIVKFRQELNTGRV